MCPKGPGGGILNDDMLRKDALDYHASKPAGKITVVPSKPHGTQRELSLAYSPGVAYPCKEIEKDPDDAYRYTSKGNLVAVVSNGTAVLGLGDIGALAGKPVMEGKGLLFKAFADIDVFDIEVDRTDVDEFVEIVKAIAPTFGGINLEDIKAPECFEIERRLVEELDIPVMHDDQHGTSIAVLAALINAIELTGKKFEDAKFVFCGAGAGGIASTKLLLDHGAKNVTLVDSTGIIHRGRTDLTPIKLSMLSVTNPDDIHGGLAEAMKGADVFVGLAVAGALTPQMVSSMAKDSIVFAMANPIPEIMPDLASAAGAAVVGTGRSDFPNQINNSLVFPGVFRGALDIKATRITTGMKLAAAQALAALIEEPTKECVIPWSLDRNVSPAVAQATASAWTAENPR